MSQGLRPGEGDRERRQVAFADPEELDTTLVVGMLEEAGLEVAVLHTTEHVAIATAVPRAAALFVSCTRVDSSLLDSLPELRIVSAMSVGVDTIEIDEARRRGIWVTNVPAAATEEVAVHAFALALALVRRLPLFDAQVRQGGWSGEGVGVLRRPSGLTVGVVGMGRIGRRLAQMVSPVFGRVLAHDVVADTSGWPPGVEQVSIDELLAASDVVSLHAPAQAGDAPLLDRPRFQAMREGSILVNVARGSLVDEAALLEALDSGHLTGAGLDVLAVEPPGADNLLLSHSGVLLSPHVAYLSEESARGYVVRAAENVASWARTGRPLDVVVEGSP